MPRGNDAADASKELLERYQTTGNAERLIETTRLSYGADLRTAQNLSENVEASRQLEKSKVASLTGADEDTIRSWAVRGDFVVAVVEDESGNVEKVVAKRDGSDVKQDAALQARANEMKALREANEEAERKIAEAREEAIREANEKAQKAQEESAKAAAKAAEEQGKVESERTSDSGGPKPKSQAKK